MKSRGTEGNVLFQFYLFTFFSLKITKKSLDSSLRGLHSDLYDLIPKISVKVYF